jgi:hypothetical protein
MCPFRPGSPAERDAQNQKTWCLGRGPYLSHRALQLIIGLKPALLKAVWRLGTQASLIGSGAFIVWMRAFHRHCLPCRKANRKRMRSGPTQVLPCQRTRPDPLAGDFEHRVAMAGGSCGTASSPTLEIHLLSVFRNWMLDKRHINPSSQEVSSGRCFAGPHSPWSPPWLRRRRVRFLCRERRGSRVVKACHRRWNAYGKWQVPTLRYPPEVGAGCGKAARPILCGGRAMKRTSLPRLRAATYSH